MERDLLGPDGYDYHQYDRIWQRVAPTLEPYPCAGASAPEEQTQTMPSQMTTPQTPPPAPLPQAGQPDTEKTSCGLGSMTKEEIQTLTEFIEDEFSDRRYYLAFARQVPAWARQTLLEFAADEGSHARQLMAVYYLITGECYDPAVSYEKIWVGPWCNALRERYHAEICGGINYMRAAESVTDPCLSKLLTELGEEEYGHARRILALLQRAM